MIDIWTSLSIPLLSSYEAINFKIDYLITSLDQTTHCGNVNTFFRCDQISLIESLWGLFYQCGLTLFPVWISYYTHYIVWHQIFYPSHTSMVQINDFTHTLWNLLLLLLDGIMMTASNGNIFRVTGHLCGEFTSPWWIPRTKASDAALLCFPWSASE